MDGLETLLADAESTVVNALAQVTTREQEHGVAFERRASSLLNAIVFVLDVLGQADKLAAQNATLDLLRRLIPPSLNVLHGFQGDQELLRPCVQTVGGFVATTVPDANEQADRTEPPLTGANPVLVALLSALAMITAKAEVHTEVLQGVVGLVHAVCGNSMTSADAILLFDFLRKAPTPARKLILQMQYQLLRREATPGAIFSLAGGHAGLLVPSTESLFSKRGYTVSLGVFLNADSRSNDSFDKLALFSFRGSQGHGISCFLGGANLVLVTHTSNDASGDHVTIVPFEEARMKMEATWVHLAVVHTKKMVFKDKVAVFVDGAVQYSGSLQYPDYVNMYGGINSIGTRIPELAAGFQGQIWCPTVFGQPLGDCEVKKLNWLAHWKSDICAVAAENASQSDKSKFVFCYDARCCSTIDQSAQRNRICYDVSGNECHGLMEPGTRVYVIQEFRDALDPIGGSACYLLLLLDQIPEMAEFHPDHELSNDEISDLLAFVACGLENGIACRSHFVRLGGVKVLAFVIYSMSPQYLTTSVLNSVTIILRSVLDHANSLVHSDQDIKPTEFIQLLLFRNANWFLAPYDTQVKLLGDVLPHYLQVLEDDRCREMQYLHDPGTESNRKSFIDMVCLPGRTVDVNFFCNLLVQVYSRQRVENSRSDLVNSEPDDNFDVLRKLIIEKLIGLLLFPATIIEDDLAQWRQVFAHIYQRCSKLSPNSYTNDDDGVEVTELLSYLTRMLANTDLGFSSAHHLMTTKICRIAQGTLRLWWCTMRTPVVNVRLEALRLFETYCFNRVKFKRDDMLMLVNSLKWEPIDMACAEVLLDLIIGRRRGGTPSDSGAHDLTRNRISASARFHNTNRIEFVPSVLLALALEANDLGVQVRVLYEVKTLMAASASGLATKEAIRSWPSWFRNLCGFVQRVDMARTDPQYFVNNITMDDINLNDACARLSDGNYTAKGIDTKLDAIRSIAESRDTRGCDFVLSAFELADQPEVILNAVAEMVMFDIPSRNSILVKKIASKMIIDITVYSVIHVRNGWIQFLEFIFHYRKYPSELCFTTATIVEEVLLLCKTAGTKSQDDEVEYMWENLSQVAALVSLLPTIAFVKMRPQHSDDTQDHIHTHWDQTRLSSAQIEIITRKAFELWVIVLPQLHAINWKLMSMQLHQTSVTTQTSDVVDSDGNVFSEDDEQTLIYHVVVGHTQSRLVALQSAMDYISNIRESQQRMINRDLLDCLKHVLETLGLVDPQPSSILSSSGFSNRLPTQIFTPSRSRTSSYSLPPPATPQFVISTTEGVGSSSVLFRAKSFVDSFFGEDLRAETEISGASIHLYVLDMLFDLFEALCVSTHCDGQLGDGDTGDIYDSVRFMAELILSVATASLLHITGDGMAGSFPAVTKTIQIIASTDLSFFEDMRQLQELLTLWQLHRNVHGSFCDAKLILAEYENQNTPFIRRWASWVETHGVEFNPEYVYKDATARAELLESEIKACENLWRKVLDDTSADKAMMTEVQIEEEAQQRSLKQQAERYASSVHKLILDTIQNSQSTSFLKPQAKKTLSLDSSKIGELDYADTDTTCESSDSPKNTVASAVVLSSSPSDNSEGEVWKIHSREGLYRMRLRLKRVHEQSRLRNLSGEGRYGCGYSGFGGYTSSFADEEELRSCGIGDSQRLLNFPGARSDSLDGAGAATSLVGRGWRSETGSDCSDFLADAQVRAAIIRSCPSVSSRGSYDCGDASEDETDDGEGYEDEETFDLGIVDNKDPATIFDAEVCDEEAVSDDNSTVTCRERVDCGGDPSSLFNPIPETLPDLVATGGRSTSPSPLASYAAFGVSLLNVVGGVAGIVQKAAKDAKDVVDYSVDSLYTARDAVRDETNNAIQEVTAVLDAAASVIDGNALDTDTLTVEGCRRPSLPTPVASVPLPSPKDVVLDFTPAPPPLRTNASLSPPLSDTRRKLSKSPIRTTKGNISGSKGDRLFDVNLVRQMHIIGGKLLVTAGHVHFFAERVVDEHGAVLTERRKGEPISMAWRFLFKRRRWTLEDIVSINRRRYLLKPTALEMFVYSTHKNYFFSFSTEVEIAGFHEEIMSRRPLRLRRDPTMRRLRHPSSIFRNSNTTARWVNHEISTFEYLMWLNTIAGRTYNDLTQYPVFPWVIADYESDSLDFAREATFRDLTKPIGALQPSRLDCFLERYHAFEDDDIPKFLYGTHYSNVGTILFYLVRLEPFTSYALSMQGGRFDHADRLFHSVAETWQNCLNDFNDLKELTPEWFYLPEFLKNVNGLELGVKQNGVRMGDVVLPRWARSAEEFVLKNLAALESEYVSAHIHRWIDLIFGHSQRGTAAVTAHNLFFYLTYEGMVDIDSITDPIMKSSVRAQIAHFGQTPSQLLKDLHPARQGARKEITATSPTQLTFPATEDMNHHRAAMLVLSVPHSCPISMVHFVSGQGTLLCVDTEGYMSTHRFGGKAVKVHHTPFMNDLTSTASKATGLFKSPPTISSGKRTIGSEKRENRENGKRALPTCESSDTISDYIELHDRKSRKVVDQGLLNRDRTGRDEAGSLSRKLAFVGMGAVYCTVGHHDCSARFHSSSDGALLYRLLQHHAIVTCLTANANSASLMALGSTDGTISVWRVASIAPTLLDSIKLFGGAKTHNRRPVHAADYAADQVLLGHAASVTCIALSEELGLCISGSIKNECISHDLADGSIVKTYDIPGRAAPGIISLTISSVGVVLIQSLGTGVPMLYSFHLNGTVLASTALGDCPMTSVAICMRYGKAIVSNPKQAAMLSLYTLKKQQVLLDKSWHGDIASQALSPDETHVVFGVGTAQIIAVSLRSIATTTAVV